MVDYSVHSPFVQQLDSELLEVINSGGDITEERFNDLALREFTIQFYSINEYGEFCRARGVTPDNITSWAEIPAMPSAIFKQAVIASFPLQETELTLMTSGTSDPTAPTKIYRDKKNVELYFQANSRLARKYLFPDVEKMKILLMVPSPKIAPAMGMAVGMEQLRQDYGTEESCYLITPHGMEWEKLFKAFHQAEESGEPIAIVGATSGLVYLYRFCQEQGLSFNLPKGSRVCDGGGYLGTFGECSREEYLDLCQKTLGVPAHYCVNTLGSGESTTNYFDNVLHNYLSGNLDIPRFKVAPPWTRTIVIDEKTGQRLPKGEIGLIRHYDLVNRANLLAVQTNNLGYEISQGFEIIGRADAIGNAAGTRLNTMIGRSGQAEPRENGGEKPAPGETCSTSAVELLENSPHGKMFKFISPERLEKLRHLCPFLQLQEMVKKKL